MNENAVYGLKMPVLVTEIFTFEKCVKYANEMTDNVIHSTRCYIKCINAAIMANLQRGTLKLSGLITVILLLNISRNKLRKILNDVF